MQRVVVKAYLPYMKEYVRDTTTELTYGWEGEEPLKVGDRVLCPKTPLGDGPFQAVVVSLETDYDGPVKSLIGKVSL